jgi:hypothetical protein
MTWTYLASQLSFGELSHYISIFFLSFFVTFCIKSENICWTNKKKMYLSIKFCKADNQGQGREGERKFYGILTYWLQLIPAACKTFHS